VANGVEQHLVERCQLLAHHAPDGQQWLVGSVAYSPALFRIAAECSSLVISPSM
jgi:hypothetical protein